MFKHTYMKFLESSRFFMQFQLRVLFQSSFTYSLICIVSSCTSLVQNACIPNRNTWWLKGHQGTHLKAVWGQKSPLHQNIPLFNLLLNCLFICKYLETRNGFYEVIWEILQKKHQVSTKLCGFDILFYGNSPRVVMIRYYCWVVVKYQ